MLLPFMILLCLCASMSSADEPVFDMHVHLHAGETSIREYEAGVAAANIELTGFGGMWFGGPNQALRGNLGKIKAGNDAVIELAAKHPGMLPIITVHPYDGQGALDELVRMARRGAKVLKIHPHTQKFDVADPRVVALVKRAGSLGLVVLVDNANILPGDSERLFNMALQARETKFIFAHIGGMNFRFWNVLALVRTTQDLFMDNIYFDISATLILAADAPIEEEFVWTLRNVGIDYVLLGSDYPQITLAKTLDALERLNLTAEEKVKIRSGNARRLFSR